MIDRRKIAVLLLMLGAGLAVASSFQQTYSTVYRGSGPDMTLTATLWIVTSDPPDGPPRDAFHSIEWPVVIAAALMVVAAVLTLKERTAGAARPVAMGAAGALAGAVLTYVLQVRQEAKIMSGWPAEGGMPSGVLTVHEGMYVLVAGAIVGLTGAVLAQRRQQREERPREEQEDEVVVHQLGGDDDTPPFGIAIPPDDEQETR